MTMNQSQDAMSKQNYTNYVIGIGASAGGLEALQRLFSMLPANTGFPYIVVQHLSPDYKSLLIEILSKYTDMPVIQVEDGMEVKPNCVYVIKPGKNMRICNGRLMLSNQREHELNLPIDLFFRSLAEEAGSRAIAIILSGTGSDGSNGIKDIREKDGMVIVQDLETSKFDGMPRSAMRTGLVDAQVSPEEMALELQHISGVSVRKVDSLKPGESTDDRLMNKIFFILKKVSNIDFAHYKRATMLRRMERRMMIAHKESLADYAEYLYEVPDEAKTLAKDMLIGVTSFFRDPEYFQRLKEKAIQSILVHSNADTPIRCWVVGCSTGEEAYSIAILFCEMMDALKLRRTIKIFATDLDAESIAMAGKGVYSDGIIEAVSPARLSRFFTHKNNTYIVNRELRKMIVFSPHNVFHEPSFSKIDLISCRNMMIYYQPVLQSDLFAIFHSALKDNGYLFLGNSESVGAYSDAFPAVDMVAKIFTHCADVRTPNSKNPLYQKSVYIMEAPDMIDANSAAYTNKEADNELANGERETVDIELLEQFMPACLIVNSKNELVHSYGDSGDYVHLSAGKFTNNLYDIITESLKIPISTLLNEVRKEKHKLQYKDIHFMGERGEAVINMTVMPINRGKAEEDTLYALVFSEPGQRGDLADALPYEIDRVASQHITDLEQDLIEAQDRLNRSIADQECVNEELQSANEELLTANEELQSSNEELQSVNEELYTVNSEYQQKLTELADLNDDLANFLSSTLIGIIFVDNKLNIRRYTDYVTTEFSVMGHDIGRSLKFISSQFPTIDMSDICNNVLSTLTPDEREIKTSKSKSFFMRVAPYRTMENKILGCVITLVDVTKQKREQAMLQSTENELSLERQVSGAKSDYMSRVADEIKLPIEALTGLPELAKDNLDDKRRLTEILDEMSRTISHINSIVGEISSASKYEQSDDLEAETAVPDKASVTDTTQTSEAKSFAIFEHGLSGRNVLVADHNELSRVTLCSTLVHEKISFMDANDGETALSLFINMPERSFDCVLIDMRMKMVNGDSTVEAIRSSRKSDARTIPIVGLFDDGIETNPARVRSVGIDACISKPADKDLLLATMSGLIRRG